LPPRAVSKLAFVCAAAAAVALGGCSGTTSTFDASNLLPKPSTIFATPDWARPASNNTGDLGPKGPVGPQDLVSADGACPPAAPDPAQAQAAAAPPPPNAPVGTPAGDLGGAQAPAGAMPGGDPGAQQALGGIALGMTECQAVHRAGQPSNVAISASNSGERKVVLTYQSGTWPGIYTFDSGRLKTIERVPGQEKPKTPAKKKPAKHAKRAAPPAAEPAVAQ
jgi:hypothetical protein